MEAVAGVHQEDGQGQPDSQHTHSNETLDKELSESSQPGSEDQELYSPEDTNVEFPNQEVPNTIVTSEPMLEQYEMKSSSKNQFSGDIQNADMTVKPTSCSSDLSSDKEKAAPGTELLASENPCLPEMSANKASVDTTSQESDANTLTVQSSSSDGLTTQPSAQSEVSKAQRLDPVIQESEQSGELPTQVSKLLESPGALGQSEGPEEQTPGQSEGPEEHVSEQSEGHVVHVIQESEQSGGLPTQVSKLLEGPGAYEQSEGPEEKVPKQSEALEEQASDQSEGPEEQESEQSAELPTQVSKLLESPGAPGQSEVPEEQTPGQSEGPEEQTPGQSEGPEEQTPGQSEGPEEQTPGQSEGPEEHVSEQSAELPTQVSKLLESPGAPGQSEAPEEQTPGQSEGPEGHVVHVIQESEQSGGLPTQVSKLLEGPGAYEQSEGPEEQEHEQEHVVQGSDAGIPLSDVSEHSEIIMTKSSKQSRKVSTKEYEVFAKTMTQTSTTVHRTTQVYHEPIITKRTTHSSPVQTIKESMATIRSSETTEHEGLRVSSPKDVEENTENIQFTRSLTVPVLSGFMALVVIITYIWMGHTQSSNSISPVLQIFHNKFNSLKADFPGQNNHLWLRSGKMLEKHLNKSQPLEPVTFILAAAQNGERTLRCLSERIAEAYAESLHAKLLMIDGPSKVGFDGIATKLQIDQELSSGFDSTARAAVFYRIETLPPGSLLILYKYCDHENAAFKKVALVLTVLLDEESLNPDMSLIALEERVKDFLWERFITTDSRRSHNEMDGDKLSGVWSRISHLVLPVLPVNFIENGICP